MGGVLLCFWRDSLAACCYVIIRHRPILWVGLGKIVLHCLSLARWWVSGIVWLSVDAWYADILVF